MGLLQGGFQSQRVSVGGPGVPSVGTHCGCQIQVISAVSDSVTNNFLGFPSEILLLSFHFFSCSSYAANSWGTTFCCISSSNIEILFWGLEKKMWFRKIWLWNKVKKSNVCVVAMGSQANQTSFKNNNNYISWKMYATVGRNGEKHRRLLLAWRKWSAGGIIWQAMAGPSTGTGRAEGDVGVAGGCQCQ